MHMQWSFFLIVPPLFGIASSLDTDTYPWENFKNKLGNVVDRNKLLGLHALVCPITKPCGPTNYYGYDFRVKTEDWYRSCRICFCSDDCLTGESCCPDLPAAYMDHECVDTLLYRSPHSWDTLDFEEVHRERNDLEDEEMSGFEYASDAFFLTDNPWNLMVSSCPEYSNATSEEILMCSAANMAPVSGKTSRISYRNRYCASCNNDDMDMVVWKVLFVCKDGMSYYRPGDLDFLDGLVNNECVVKYDPMIDDTYPPAYPCHFLKRYTYKVGKCNITGLWAEYDADIDWACSNLNLPFKRRFKNVFCYICNPSIASSKSELVYDRCNLTGLWKKTDAAVENACLTYPRIQRLSPFKNVYCLICNGYSRINKVDMVKEHGLTSITELYLSETRTVPPVSVFLKITGDDIIEKSLDAIRVIAPEFNGFTYEIEREEKHSHGSLNNMNISAEVNAYVKACGYEEMCESDVVSPEVQDQTHTYERYPYCKCSCEASCAALGECCVDKLFGNNPYTCVKNPRLLTKQKSEVDFIPDQGGSMTVIDKCLNRTDVDLVKRCEVDNYNRSDILQYIPVYNVGAYKNIYCLMCNDKKPEPLFRISIQCENYLETALIKRLSHLIDLAGKHCKVQVIPKNYNRLCGTFLHYPDIISSCNETGNWFHYDEMLAAGCETSDPSPQNFLPMFITKMGNFSFSLYKNYFCFLCNPRTSLSSVETIYDSCNMTGRWTNHDDYLEQSCLKVDPTDAWLPYKNVYCYLCNEDLVATSPTKDEGVGPTPPEQGTQLDPNTGQTYRMMFSLNSEEWQAIYPDGRDPNAICSEGYMYDYSKRVCRIVLCSEDRILMGEICVPVSTLIPKGHVAIYFTIKLYLVFRPMMYYEPWFNENLINDMDDYTTYVSLKFLCDKFSSELEQALKEGETKLRLSACQLLASNKNCTALPNKWEEIVNTVEPIMDINEEILILKLNFAYFDNEVRVSTINQFFSDRFKEAREFFELYSEFEYELSVDNNPHDFITIKENGDTCDIDVDYPYFLQDHPLFQMQNSNPGNGMYITPPVEEKIISCPQIELEEGEFIFDNATNTIVIQNGTKRLVKGEFALTSDAKVRVCQSDYLASLTRTVQQGTFQRVHNIFSYVFTLISLLCLLFTFITYCIFSELRTVPGKNIMSLCFSLFVAQGSLQFSSFILTYESICVPFAILTHYSWLATFFAMNICSFHMYRLFYNKMMSSPDVLRSYEHTKYYLIYTYSLPFAVVGITTAIHLGISNGEFTGYGKSVCFLSGIYTTVFTFILPAALILCFNFAFFGIAFHAIRTSPRIGSTSRERHEFFMCLKLCTLTGVSWPLQIIDGFLPLTVFSFMAIFFNALQGLFIFISYVCNKRVLMLFSSLWSGKKDSLTDGKISASRPSLYFTASSKTKTESLKL